MILVWLDLLLHRYIRSGETLTTYADDWIRLATYKVRLEGWGPYAAVRPADSNIGAIRRDGILKDANGNWFYRYDE